MTEIERLSAAVAAIGGIIASLPETAKVDLQSALSQADSILGHGASGEVSREVRRTIEDILRRAGSAQSARPKET